MRAFREAFEKRDATKAVEQRTADGEAVIASRRATPRNGVTEASLREELAEDLGALFNTVHLAASESLDGLPEVQRSILNYGVEDLSSVSAYSERAEGIGLRLQQVLRDHEDRLVEGSIRLKTKTLTNDHHARIAIQIQAEMYASPADVPIEFVADLESGSGRIGVKQG